MQGFREELRAELGSEDTPLHHYQFGDSDIAMMLEQLEMGVLINDAKARAFRHARQYNPQLTFLRDQVTIARGGKLGRGVSDQNFRAAT